MMSAAWRGALACALLVIGPARAPAQQPPADEVAKLQKIMMEAMTPGAEHEALARLAGEWTASYRMWPSPGADPIEFTGTVRNRMILGGRFLVSEAEAGEGAMATSSMTILGFDRRSSDYTAVALDTWGTYWVTAAGKLRPSDGAIVMHGEDPVAGTGHTQTYDFILRTLDADTHVFEVVFTDPVHTKGGGPFRMVEITFKRSSDR